ERLLASAYQSCLNLAEKHQVKSISFPSLSTGIYGYPLELAAPVALHTIIEHVKKPTCLQRVLMVLFGEHAYKVHEQALDKLL
ncbi:MAG: macro domain-containing protein, partial [Ktedonobacteraceae bacterium]